jgi:hypothetical protein
MTTEDYANVPETEEHQPWSNEAMLMAGVLEGIRDLLWFETNKYVDTSKGQTKAPFPARIFRPGVDKEPQKQGLPLSVMESMQRKRLQREALIATELAMFNPEGGELNGG